MKKVVLFLGCVTCMFLAQAQEYKVVTTVESIVPMGLGRSRIIDATEKSNHQQFTTARVDGKKSDQGKIKRKGAKIGGFEETKMLNFYSGVGLNFQNIASNDALITSKLNQMSADGWKLVNVVSGVESDSGDGDGKGIFITRYIFMR